jgi:hypothetical protein
VDAERVLVIYDCAADDGEQIPNRVGLTKRAYFRRHWEGQTLRNDDIDLVKWLDQVNSAYQDAEGFRGLKSAIKSLLP